MLIRITLAGEVVLTDAEDFRCFSIRYDPGARGRAARPDDASAWVSEEAPHRTAQRGSDPEWQAGLACMTVFARSRGWMDDQGDIRAHIQAAA